MSDPRQPTQEELRAYVEQLREADPADLVAQAFTMLGTGAEVKLGRHDARVLIDAMAGLVQGVEGKVPADLVGRMREGVVQLQTAQVQAEAAAQREGAAAQDEQAPAGTQPGQPAPGAQPGQPGPGAQPGQQRATDRLWIPGRDRGPGPAGR